MDKTSGETFTFRRGTGTTLLITCGALAREVVSLIEMNRWRHLDVACLPAKLHHTPALIPDAVRAKIQSAKDRYEHIYVLYGDCGTAGALDAVIDEAPGVERIPGPHCFSFFAGNDAFEARADDDMSAFFLTDYFCRHFETFVWKALALDKHPGMLELVFGNYEKLVFLPQIEDPSLTKKARDIASQLGLAFEVRGSGYGDLATFMASRPTQEISPT